MKPFLDAFLDGLALGFIFSMQTGLILVLCLLAALLVCPEAVLLRDVVKFLKGLV